MYAVSKEHKGTNKLFAKTRRAGISQKLDNLDNSRDASAKREVNSLPVNHISSTPKPIFHLNGRDRRSYNHKSNPETITVQHEEIIKYIHDSWKCVKRELDSGTKCSLSGDLKNSKVPLITYYKLDKGNSSYLPVFEPFDLETFWGQRLFQNITQST